MATANDIWGWTDPVTGKEYAIVGRTNGTAFVDISNPTSPVYLGNLPTATTNSGWRDMKVHNNHAYIVAEAGSHGLQVFDLTRLRNVTNPPATFTADARNTSFGNAHNIAINEETGYAYVIGSNTCAGGPRMFNLANPKSPVFAGCVSGDGYTHDTQAVVYRGPHTTYRGREILFSSNEDTLTIVDATNKSSPVQLSRKGYSTAAYAHQGWLTEDHRYFVLDDEADEGRYGFNTRTYVWDVSNLANPVLIGYYSGTTPASDHNLYIKGNFAYESNYKAGLQIIDLTNIANPSTMKEVAYFDVYPQSNTSGYAGTWSNYPFFRSGTVIVNSIDRGLFVLKPNLVSQPPGVTVFSDDFETNKGWTTNPYGTDTATAGVWERGDPEATTYNGATYQLGTTTSGVNGLVTGRLAGTGVGAYDIDGGLTSVRSPAITLPTSGAITLTFSWYLAYLDNSSSDDYFRVRIVHSGGTTTVFQQLGAAGNRAANWATGSVNLSGYAGQSIRVLIEAADAGTASLVEAGVDDVKITKA